MATQLAPTPTLKGKDAEADYKEAAQVSTEVEQGTKILAKKFNSIVKGEP